MNRLAKEHPEKMIIHITVPIKSTKLSFKRRIKNLLTFNKYITKPDNIKRNLFNEMLREEYSDKMPIFDLADIESTYPDGNKETFRMDNKEYYAMVAEYTNDGGHLNETGRKIVAEQLLLFLAELISDKK